MCSQSGAREVVNQLGDRREPLPFPDIRESTDLRRDRSGDDPVGQGLPSASATACNLGMRSTVHLWPDLNRRKCAWAEIYYQAHRKKGNTYAIALRCLGQRWLKILWKMWQTGKSYDEALHTRNQTEHGSWVLFEHELVSSDGHIACSLEFFQLCLRPLRPILWRVSASCQSHRRHHLPRPAFRPSRNSTKSAPSCGVAK